jgi:hypothetical protein
MPLVKMGLEPNARRYVMNECTIIIGSSTRGYHMSISHPTRFPTWDEIKTARYNLCPKNITMAMLLPPENEYVNLHPNCFHLWQVRGDFE